MLAAAQAEAARNLDGWQRTQAEFANARKRLEKQRVDDYTLLPTPIDPAAQAACLFVDDFERALAYGSG
jgi:molecular chaperone GrpE (heat shock protein)